MPGVAVAVNVRGDPVAPLSVAVAVCAPEVWPSFHVVVATPFMSVTDVSGVTEAPEPAAAHVTVSPDFGVPRVTTTRSGLGSVVRTESVWPSPLAVAAF
jgi:hypothetical protein